MEVEQPLFYVKREGKAEGPTVEIGDTVTVIWRRSELVPVRKLVAKSDDEGESHVIGDGSHWTNFLLNAKFN